MIIHPKLSRLNCFRNGISKSRFDQHSTFPARESSRLVGRLFHKGAQVLNCGDAGDTEGTVKILFALVGDALPKRDIRASQPHNGRATGARRGQNQSRAHRPGL